VVCPIASFSFIVAWLPDCLRNVKHPTVKDEIVSVSGGMMTVRSD